MGPGATLKQICTVSLEVGWKKKEIKGLSQHVGILEGESKVREFFGMVSPVKWGRGLNPEGVWVGRGYLLF